MTRFVPHRRSPRLRQALGGVLVAVLAAGTTMGCLSSEVDPDDEDAITLGLLLPFTGASAGTAHNFERAVLFAVDVVNESGGIDGMPLRVVARDTHSDVERAAESVDELIAEGARVVIGPESADVAKRIAPTLHEAEIVFVSPFVGAGRDEGAECESPWFQLAPSATAMGEALANRLGDKGIRSIAILYGEGDYDRAFRAGVSEKFGGLVIGGEVVTEIALEEGASSYREEIEAVRDMDPEAIVLSLSPETAAFLVTEYSVLAGSRPLWGFSPLLKTPLFLLNIDSATVEGAIGVAPKIFDTTDAFPSAFAERFRGDSPLEGAYFYYDAVGLLSLALGIVGDKGDVTYEQFTTAIVQAASSTGQTYGWDELPEALDDAADGVTVNYSGLTGPLLFSPCGERRSGRTEAWTVTDGEIEVVDG